MELTIFNIAYKGVERGYQYGPVEGGMTMTIILQIEQYVATYCSRAC